MEAAAAPGGPEPERPEGRTGPDDLSPDATKESPEPEELDGPGESSEPRPEVPLGPRPEGPEESEPCEPEKLRLEETEPPGPEPCEPEKVGLEEPSEPVVAEGPPWHWEPSDPGFPVPTPAAGGTEEEARGRDGAAGEAPPAVGAEEVPRPPAPAVPELRSSEAAGEEPEEQDVAEEDEEERRERAALLEEHCGLAGERERLQQASARLQMRLGELLRLGRGERRRRAALGADGPQLYAQRLLQLQELRQQRERAAAASQERVAARRWDVEERQARAQAEWAAFQTRKKAVAVSSFGRWPGGGEAAAVDRIQAREWDKEQQVREARVENIRLKHEIQNLETILKAQEEQVKSQHFMDFEHVKKENQTYTKRIDNLSDEILKLKKKVSNTVHILSHFREKLQFVEAETQCRKAELMDIETVLSHKRDILTKTKQARDKLWRNNLKLQEKCGLLGNEILLRDFEEKVDAVGLLSQRLERLKHHHAALILTCKGIKKKKQIKEVNSSFLAEDDLRKESMEKK